MQDIHPKSSQSSPVADLKSTLNFLIQKRLSRRLGIATAPPLKPTLSKSFSQSKNPAELQHCFSWEGRGNNSNCQYFQKLYIKLDTVTFVQDYRVIWVTRMTLVTSITWTTRVNRMIRKTLSDSRDKGDLGN